MGDVREVNAPPDPSAGYSVIGKGRPIKDAALKVTGQKQYIDDMSFTGLLHAKILYSPKAHARITSIDTSKAEAYPGVKAVACYKNAPQVRYNSAVRFIENELPATERIFDDTVRFVGDRVAAVAAETAEIAEAALKLIEVTYEDLPVITDVEEAARPYAYPIHEGGNIVGEAYVNAGDVEKGFAESDHVISDRFTTQAIHPAAMELHAAVADWHYDNKLTIYGPCQNTFGWRVILGRIFDLPYNKIRLITPAIGGGFGGKLEMTMEPVAALLSKMTHRPVKIAYSRKESMLSARVRHASVGYVKVGYMNDGRINAVDIRMYTNTGAYASSALNVSGAMSHKVFKTYKIANMRFKNNPVYTNTPIAGAMRGYGSPQAYFGMERLFNTIAHNLDMDPAEIQRINLVDPDSLDPCYFQSLGNPRPKECLEKVLKLINYDEAMAEMEASKKENGRYRIGVGVSCGVHGNNCFGAHRDVTSLMLKMNEDGSAILYTGSHDMGHDPAGTQIAIISEVLGIPIDRIDAVQADSDVCLWHLGDFASRGTYIVGKAAYNTAQKMKKELQIQASELLEVPAEEIALKDNKAFWEKDPGKSVTIPEVMLHCQRDHAKELVVSDRAVAESGPTSYGLHACKVRVDTETGKVELLDYAAVHDVGNIINRLMLEGQLQGGIHMGLGYALTEEVKWDDEGKPLTFNLGKYHILKASEMPKLHIDFVYGGEGEPGGPYGAKSMGESPVVPVAPTVLNAISNAIDCEINDLPASPERILKVLKEKAGEQINQA